MAAHVVQGGLYSLCELYVDCGAHDVKTQHVCLETGGHGFSLHTHSFMFKLCRKYKTFMVLKDNVYFLNSI